MKRIAVLSPVHRRPDLLLAQLVNYNKYSNNSCDHFLHVSRDGRGNFQESDIETLVNEGGAIFTKYSNGTSWRTCIGAFIACSELIDENIHDFVYVHTDADLIISGNLQNYIYEHKLGYGSVPIAKAKHWIHSNKLIEDKRFKELRDSIGLSFGDVVFGRQEGAFYPVDLWKKIISEISRYYDASFFDYPDLHWPIEESIIPTLAKKFSYSSPHVWNIVRTKELTLSGGRDNPENCINLNDLEKYIGTPGHQCIALKWFSQNLSDVARLKVTNDAVNFHST